MSRRFAAWIVRLRYAVVAVWIGVLALSLTLLPDPASSKGTSLSALVPADSAAVAAAERSATLFRFPALADTAVVQRDPDGLSVEAQQRAFERAIELTRSPDPDATGIALLLPVANTLELFPASRERSTTIVTYLFVLPDRSARNRVDLANLYASRYVGEPDDALIGVTGAVPAQVEQFRLIGEGLPRVELATVAVLALLVGLTFRSLGAPILTLAAAGLATLVASRLIAGLGQLVGVAIPREIEPLVVVLVLAIVTDYCIFFLSDFRDRLRNGESKHDAAIGTASGTIGIVLTAGLIVAAGTASLLAGTLEFFRAFGPGLALASLVGVAVSITLVPALLAVAGGRLFWPSRVTPDGRHVRDWRSPGDVGVEPEAGARLTRFAVRRPWITLAVAGGGLAIAATGFLRLDLGLTLITGLPRSTEVRQASSAAGSGFAAGILSPTELLVERPGIASEALALVELERLLELQPGVAAVIGPRENPTGQPYGAVLSETGDASRYLLILDATPLGSRAIERLRLLERRLPGILDSAGLSDATASTTGATALAKETVDSVVDDLGRIAAAVCLANFVLLALFLRSVVAPLYLLATSILALAASLGLTSYVFQDLLGYDEVTHYVPFVVAVLLLSLGSDYNVFIVGRVWQEAANRPLREAVEVAAPRAAHAITYAGIALASSFALLALVPIRVFREFAFSMSVGILIETFVARSLLVPALISIFGPLSRWPSRPPAAPSQSARGL